MLLHQIYSPVYPSVLPARVKDDHYQVTGVSVNPQAGNVPLRESINKVTSVLSFGWFLMRGHPGYIGICVRKEYYLIAIEL